MSAKRKYFEDIAVGDVACFGRYEVTREEILEFAGRYDPQPFHLSDEAAAATHFGRLSASGWHTGSMSMAMLARQIADEGLAGLGSPGIDELRWLKPVHPGDVLSCETEVLNARQSRSRPEMGIVRNRLTVLNQDGDAVMRYVYAVMLETRPA